MTFGRFTPYEALYVDKVEGYANSRDFVASMELFQMTSWQHPSEFRSALSTLDASKVRLIATDMDGTLTREDRLSQELLADLEALQAANLPVIVTTGRSAGWVSGLLHYLPISGAIAENGGIFYSGLDRDGTGEILNVLPSDHRDRLRSTFTKLCAQFPQLQESSDNRFRLTDWTFDVAGLDAVALAEMGRICQDDGYSFTYSTVQCHIKPRSQDKAQGLHQVLRQHFPLIAAESVVTIGDSPNDESLFTFDLSVGVANLNRYVNELEHLPKYWASREAGEGFSELVQHLLG
jgi:HAD superfamily hydrolase (TIGR01484 family)